MEWKMFTILFMLFCVIQQSTALKCVSCSTLTNPKCGDVEDKGFQLQDCIVENVVSPGSSIYSQLILGGNNTHPNANRGTLIPTCLKIVLKYADVTAIDRRCSVKYQNEDSCADMPTAGDSHKVFCGTCEKDGCNSGNSMQLYSSLIVVGAMVCTLRLFV